MSTDEFIKEYEAALDVAAQATKTQIEAENRVKVLEMRAKLLSSQTSGGGNANETDSFIAANYLSMTEEDHEFVEQKWRTVVEVHQYLDESESTVRRRCDKGIYESKRLSNNHYRVNTLSVAKQKIDKGNEAWRNLGGQNPERGH